MLSSLSGSRVGSSGGDHHHLDIDNHHHGDLDIDHHHHGGVDIDHHDDHGGDNDNIDFDEDCDVGDLDERYPS